LPLSNATTVVTV